MARDKTRHKTRHKTSIEYAIIKLVKFSYLFVVPCVESAELLQNNPIIPFLIVTNNCMMKCKNPSSMPSTPPADCPLN